MSLSRPVTALRLRCGMDGEVERIPRGDAADEETVDVLRESGAFVVDGLFVSLALRYPHVQGSEPRTRRLGHVVQGVLEVVVAVGFARTVETPALELLLRSLDPVLGLSSQSVVAVFLDELSAVPDELVNRFLDLRPRELVDDAEVDPGADVFVVVHVHLRTLGVADDGQRTEVQVDALPRLPLPLLFLFVRIASFMPSAMPRRPFFQVS